MKHKLNKPRVFLSHSKKDEKFIQGLHNDLRKCQIDPWMDTEEIRDGKSWLKVIFEDGIPTCDVVIVYFTENSLASKMVGKEVDAALVEHLSEKGIAFLPYVENEELRAKLRSDIRSLQCRVWNHTNYSEILPTVVAEIWHTHLERVVQIATLQERNFRLELELEVSRLKEKNINDIFLPAEDTDFRNVYERLNKQITITYDLWERIKSDSRGKLIGKDTFKFNLFKIMTNYIREGHVILDNFRLEHSMEKYLETCGYPSSVNELHRYYGNIKMNYDYIVNLRTYGLIRKIQVIDHNNKTTYENDFTEKMYRFLYWTEYNKYEPEGLGFEYVGLVLSDAKK